MLAGSYAGGSFLFARSGVRRSNGLVIARIVLVAPVETFALGKAATEQRGQIHSRWVERIAGDRREIRHRHIR